MRVQAQIILLLLVLAAPACNRARKTSGEGPGAEASLARSQTPTSSPDNIQTGDNSLHLYDGFLANSKVEGANVAAQFRLSTTPPMTETTDRKIIRNGELTIETDTPKDAQARIASIAESQGGFVVTSEFKQNISGTARPTEIVTVVVRVPSAQFGATLDAIRAAGNRVIQERISGQDVTEEYIDLEARIRTQKALEQQFLEIMKQAKRIADALEVQRQLADVRTEVERLEGRRRFLDNKASLSTITVTLQSGTPMVAATTSGFGHDVKDAFGDGIDTAVAIVMGLIRIAIVLVPITLLILLPGWFLLRSTFRRFSWPRRNQPVAVTPVE